LGRRTEDFSWEYGMLILNSIGNILGTVVPSMWAVPGQPSWYVLIIYYTHTVTAMYHDIVRRIIMLSTISSRLICTCSLAGWLQQ
jgi:hypothetical protein